MYSKLAPVIRHHIPISLESSDWANCDNVTSICLDHVGKELAEDPEMTEDIYGKCFFYAFRGEVEEFLASTYSSVVDYHSDWSNFAADLTQKIIQNFI